MSVEAPPKQSDSIEAESWLFDLAGMDCGDCARSIEAGVRRLPGVNDAQVNFGSATLRVTPDMAVLSPGVIVAAVSQAGYRAQPRGSKTTSAKPWWRERRTLEIASAGLLWAIGVVADRAGAPTVILAIPYLAAMTLAGYPVARAALYSLKARRADMNLLMTIAAIGAIPLGKWEEGSSVLLLFAIGLLLQSHTIDRTRRAIQALVRLAPDEANVRRTGVELRIPITAVVIGDVVIVRPGERLPIDGEVVSGVSEIDQCAITGESMPVDVAAGATVYAGSMNGSGALEIVATKTIQHSAISGIVRMVERAQSSRAPAQAFVDRFAAIYTPIVVAGAFALALVGFVITGDARHWIFQGLVMLVVACPCALVISTPVALVSAIGSAARQGVLFKSGSALESLASVKAVAFDKTGTLTHGRPAVSRIVAFAPLSENEVLALAAAVERGAAHPIARGIVTAAKEREIEVPDAFLFRTIPGLGAQAEIDGLEVSVRSQRDRADLTTPVATAISELEAAGNSVVMVDRDDETIGLIGLIDRSRKSANGVIGSLHELGLRTFMLSGDSQRVADRIGTAAGIGEIHGELMPADKVVAIKDLAVHGGIAMVGDGINDAPALASASVGIAMGVAGSDVAIEAADVALLADDLNQIPTALRLARSTMQIIRQNIAVALLVKVVFIALTIAGITNLWLAVAADMGTSLLVTANALRLLRVGASRWR